MNKFHPSTIICPITTNVKPGVEILRVLLNRGFAKLKEDCDIMIDQMRPINNRKLIKRLCKLYQEKVDLIKTNLLIVLDI